MNNSNGVAAFAVVMILVACEPAGSPAPPSPPPRVDHSLTTAEYLQLGMPAPDRVWTILDYQTALGVVAALPNEQLPHWQNSQSAEIYAQFTDPRSLESCANHIHHLNLRMQSCMVLVESLGGIHRRYVAAAQSGSGYIEEIAPIMASSLRLAAAMSTTGDEFMASLDRGDPSFQVRQQGLAQMDLGINQIVQGAIYSISAERALYSNTAALQVAQALAETFPILGARMPPLTRAEFEGKLREIATEDRSIEVRAALSAFAQPTTTQ